MKDSNKAIGIFDSGIGGLTVADHIQKIMPNENLIYFGDTEHLPYGEKSEDAVRHYSEGIASFLASKDCKAIVIACNTASSLGFDAVRRLLPEDIIVWNVIDSVVDELCKAPDRTKIGVIGTRATIKSEIYSKKLMQKNPALIVKEMATPLFAPMIEEGFFNNQISKTVIDSYLSQEILAGIDKLILACTHYPLIESAIDEYYQNKVHIINSAALVAEGLKLALSQRALLNKSNAEVEHHFYISDYTEAFEKSARTFFKGEIHFTELKLWGE